MAQHIHRHSRSTGLPPGTLVYLGKNRQQKARISVLDYDAASVRERDDISPDGCVPFIQSGSVSWINVTGLEDVEAIRDVCTRFTIHPLAMADIVNTGHRPKVEDYGDYLFFVVKMLYVSDDDHVVAEHVSVILGRHYVLSFQEVAGDVFGAIRDRVRHSGGRIRRMGCDYLAYSLLDAVVDHYFGVMESLAERIEALQDAVLGKDEPDILQDIHALRREMIFIRKCLWPLRELLSTLERSDSDLIGDDIAPYLRDVHEHTFQLIDTAESLRDLLTGALDIYMSNVSNRMNEVMKVLTIIATIFIPLTFIAGIYGMNFKHMPELDWPLGYVAVWSVMVVVAAGMVAFFRRKRWI